MLMDQMKAKTAKAILISDIHYSLNTLELADAAMRQAINKANELNVPLIVAGDLHDSKANMRAECVNRMLETFSLCETTCYILRGNHDQINEKSEEHALEFLNGKEAVRDDFGSPAAYIFVVDKPGYFNDLGTVNARSVHLIPYHHSPDALRNYLKKVDKGSLIIMHQGVRGSNAGEYIQDKSAINKEDVSEFRVISGHYHTRQTIKCRPLPRCIAGSFEAIREEHALHNRGIGKWDYIGNPYTLNFAEANDPPKGFQILMDDGSLEFVPTNLRKHVKLELEGYNLDLISGPGTDTINPEDLVWVQVIGTKEQLARHTKQSVSKKIGIDNFRLDLIPVDDSKVLSEPQKQRTQTELLDDLVDAANATDDCKARLKQMWRDL